MTYLRGGSRRRNNTTKKVIKGLSSSIFQDDELFHNRIGGSVNPVKHFDSFLDNLIQFRQILLMFELIFLPAT